jgi:hypothetical protein
MINEFRSYRIKVGKLGEYMAAFEEIGLPIIKRHLHLLGFWTSDVGELNHVFHLWEFEDMEQRTARYAALRAEPDWQQKFQPIALPIIEKMHSTLLTPARFSPMLSAGLASVPGMLASLSR